MNINHDIVCQVYAGNKSKKAIELVLSTFIPDYEKIDLNYTSRIDDEYYKFETEDEMINYFLELTGVSQTFYWNKRENNPHRIMVGANLTNDDTLIMSLTFDGNDDLEIELFEKLKTVLNSNIGVISYINPAEYENGKDFISKYSIIN